MIRNQDHVYLRTSKGDAVEQLVEGARDTNIKVSPPWHKKSIVAEKMGGFVGRFDR